MDKETLEKVFDDFDQDKSGKIDAKELRNVVKGYNELVGKDADDAAIDAEVGAILVAVDTSGDGKLDKKEFLKFFDL
jgi:Ca2+-binding EF-hand superfamily protein